jgi:hypothetical protein
MRAHNGEKPYDCSNVTWVLFKMVNLRHTFRHTFSNLTRNQLNLVTLGNTRGHTVGRSFMLVSYMAWDSLNLVTWSFTCGHTVGRSLMLVINVTGLTLHLVTWINILECIVERSIVLVSNVTRDSFNLRSEGAHCTYTEALFLWALWEEFHWIS